MKITFKTVLSYITYIFILLGCYFLIKKIPSFTPPVILVIEYSSYIIFGLGLLLSIRFNKGRVFLMLLQLTLFELLLSYYTELSINVIAYSQILYRIICILTPLNFIAFSQSKEKGIFSLWGKIRISFILIEILFI